LVRPPDEGIDRRKVPANLRDLCDLLFKNQFIMFDVSGKSALITGGTSGIGAAIANRFFDAGCRVIAAGLAEEKPSAALNAEITVAPLNVSEPKSIESLVAGLGELDVLVNAAGIIRRAAEFELEQFQMVVDVNLVGSMRMCTACKPLLLKRGGAIVNVASMYSFFGAGLAPGYSASKGGVAQLTKSLAVAWAPHNIRINAVAPGWIATPLTQALRDDPARYATVIERTPLKRWGQPDDIAGAVIFLCSPAAAFITGVILPVDGGYLIS
jgi:NAD(P)-dependent dehydrogenase (short-subunit alcohol dehydrogenase family)